MVRRLLFLLRPLLFSCFLLFGQILPKVAIESVGDMIVISGQSSSCFGIKISPASADIDPETIMITGYRVLRSTADFNNLTAGDLQSRGNAKLSDIYDKTTGQSKVIKCYFQTKNTYAIGVHRVSDALKDVHKPVYLNPSDVISIDSAAESECAQLKNYDPLGLKPFWTTRRKKIAVLVVAPILIAGTLFCFRRRQKEVWIQKHKPRGKRFLLEKSNITEGDWNLLTPKEQDSFLYRYKEAQWHSYESMNEKRGIIIFEVSNLVKRRKEATLL